MKRIAPILASVLIFLSAHLNARTKEVVIDWHAAQTDTSDWWPKQDIRLWSEDLDDEHEEQRDFFGPSFESHCHNSTSPMRLISPEDMARFEKKDVTIGKIRFTRQDIKSLLDRYQEAMVQEPVQAQTKSFTTPDYMLAFIKTLDKNQGPVGLYFRDQEDDWNWSYDRIKLVKSAEPPKKFAEKLPKCVGQQEFFTAVFHRQGTGEKIKQHYTTCHDKSGQELSQWLN